MTVSNLQTSASEACAVTRPLPLVAQRLSEIEVEIAADALLLEGLHRETSSLLGPVDTSFRALSGRLECTVRRRKFNNDSLLLVAGIRHRGCVVEGDTGACAPI